MHFIKLNDLSILASHSKSLKWLSNKKEKTQRAYPQFKQLARFDQSQRRKRVATKKVDTRLQRHSRRVNR